MWRLVFLFLVVLGALATFLGLAVGVGAWKAARLQQQAAEVPAPTTAPAASTGPATAPAAEAAPPDAGPPRPASRPKVDNDPNAKPGAGAAGAANSRPRAGDREQGDWPPPDPAAGGRRRPPADGGDLWVAVPPRPDQAFPRLDPAFQRPAFPRADPNFPRADVLVPRPPGLDGHDVLIPGPPRGDLRFGRLSVGSRMPPLDPDAAPLVLDAASAVVHGDGGLHVAAGPAAADPKALVDWRAESDTVSWAVDVPTTGMYVVELEYACDPQAGGGAYWVQLNQALAARLQVRLTQLVRPTGGREDYRTVNLGLTYLPAGRTDVLVRPVSLKTDRPLMNLRAIRLRLTKDERGRDRE
jgi:hypothetical protein